MFEKVTKETNKTISNYVSSVFERFSELCYAMLLVKLRFYDSLNCVLQRSIFETEDM